MEFHLGGLGVRRLWLLLNILALHDVTRPGIVVLADDFDMCVRDNDSEISVSIGDILSLSCLTDIEPPRNRLTWFRNDNAIGDDDKIIIIPNRVPCTLETGEENEENCDSLQLSIFNVTKDDEGLYICRGAQRENGTIFVRVVEGTSATTSTFAGTTLMTPLLTKPTCSSNISSDVVLLPSDTVMFTCLTDMNTFSAGSLDWLGHENIQTKDNNSYSTSLVIDVQTALPSHLLCQLSCDESVQTCQMKELSCGEPLFSVSPLQQEAEVGGNVSFTCEVRLKNYTVIWFVSGSINFGSDQLYFQNFNDGRNSVITILNLRPNETGPLYCMVLRYGVGVGTYRTVRFRVASPPGTSSNTKATEESLLGEQTAGPASPQPPTTWCVYLSRLDDTPSSSPLSPNLIIIIAVFGGVALIIMAIIIGILCCRRRNHQPSTISFNPTMASRDLSHDNPMDMDIHLNEGARSSDILHPYSMVIHGRHKDHIERTPSSLSITEENDDEEPGRNLSQLNHEYAYVINA